MAPGAAAAQPLAKLLVSEVLHSLDEGLVTAIAAFFAGALTILPVLPLESVQTYLAAGSDADANEETKRRSVLQVGRFPRSA